MSSDMNANPRKKLWKFSFLMILTALGFLAIITKLFYIQVLNADYYKQKAERQHNTTVQLKANRGSIFDSEGKLIATTYTSYTIAVDPFVIEDPELIASAVNSVTDISYNSLLKKTKKKGTQFVVLTKNLHTHQIEELIKIKDKGLIIIPEPRRLFIYGETLSQVVGVTDTENKGISGIELKWDSFLKGESGYIVMNKDGRRRLKPAADLPLSPAKHGNSIELTIDIELQRIVEHELKAGVNSSDAESGTVVIIEPATGKVLAMASYPSFNPNTKKGSTPENMRIRAITDSYEPGSTFKIITAAMAMDMGYANGDTKFYGYRGFHSGRGFRIRDIHPLDTATFKKAIIHSSNIIFGQVANSIPDNIFYKYIRDFGFGITLGIDLPGEVSGNVIKPANFSGVSKRYMGHGYELAATPLQLTNAYAAIANNGNMMKPYLISKIYDENNRIIKEYHPELIRKVIADTTAGNIAELFTAVVDSGTGKAARIGGLKIAGKTGTAQQVVDGRYSKQYYTASFAGFFPADEPRIAMSVIIDKPRGSYYGGATAAPIFQRIASKIVSSKKYNINIIDDNSNNDTTIVPDFTGLSTDEAKIIASLFNIKVKYDNKGIIYSQSHKAGDSIDRGNKISLATYKEILINDEQKPDLTGIPLSKAVTILLDKNVEVSVKGSGRVTSQKWSAGKDGKPKCTIYCN